MKQITFLNDFHYTDVTINIKGDTLTPSQIKRIKRILCGIKGCTCGTIRGPQLSNDAVDIWEDSQCK
jgi:hypothetical protein